MSKTRRAVICILLLCGVIPLLAATHKDQLSREQSAKSHKVTPHSPVRPNCGCEQEGPAPTYLPQFFEAPEMINGGDGKPFVATGDFNSDGKPDLLIQGGAVRLINTDGTFSTIGSGGRESIAVAVYDFNHDGNLDMAMVQPGYFFQSSASASPSRVHLGLGNGDGTFLDQQNDYPLGGLPDTVPGSELMAAGDFNGDGNLDLAALNTVTLQHLGASFPQWGESTDGSISVLLGNGDGTFQSNIDFPAGHLPTSLVAGDFNGDGKTDLAVVRAHDGEVAIMLGNGDATFQASVTYPVTNAGTIAVASLRGDGRSDLIVTCSDVTVRVLLNNGDGTFQPAIAYGIIPGNGGLGAPAIADVNGDGKFDVAFVSGSGYSVGVLFGNGDGTFGEERLFGTRYESESVFAADFNGDGKVDLAVADSVLVGNGDGTFQARFDYGVQGTVNAAAFTDFNQDGDSDLAATSFCNSPNCTGATVSILQGDGTGSLGPPASYAVGTGASAIAFGDFNKDGVLDVVTGNFTTGSSNTLGISVLLSNTDGTFQTSTDYPGAQVTNTNGGDPPKGASVAVADLNGDGNPDVVATAFGLGLLVWLGNGDGTFQQAVQYTDVGGGSSALALGDFNGDGKSDVAIANGTRFVRAGLNVCDGTSVSLLLGRGDGTFGPPASYEAGFAPESLAVGDFNGDGKLDLVVVGNWNDGQWCPLSQVSVSILLGNGDGTFQKHIDTWVEAEKRVPDLRVSLAVGDFNLDGWLDVVLGASYGNTVSVLYGDGDGTLQGNSMYNIGGYPGPIAVGDFNKDGRPDLATANWGTSTVSLLRNIQTPDFYMQAVEINTMTRGQAASSSVTIKSILGYSNTVALSCYAMAEMYEPENPSTTCSISPATVQLAANGTATATLTITTSGSAAAISNAPFRQDGRRRYAFWMSISGLAFAVVSTIRIRKSRIAIIFAGTVVAALLVLSACGGSGGSGGTSGSGSSAGGNGGSRYGPAVYDVGVAATSGNLVRVTGFRLTVQ